MLREICKSLLQTNLVEMASICQCFFLREEGRKRVHRSKEYYYVHLMLPFNRDTRNTVFESSPFRCIITYHILFF